MSRMMHDNGIKQDTRSLCMLACHNNVDLAQLSKLASDVIEPRRWHFHCNRVDTRVVQDLQTVRFDDLCGVELLANFMSRVGVEIHPASGIPGLGMFVRHSTFQAEVFVIEHLGLQEQLNGTAGGYGGWEAHNWHSLKLNRQEKGCVRRQV